MLTPERLFYGAVIVVLVLLMRRTRGLALRVDSLRKTMNEAIIHDLKNPMTAIMGCLSCLLEDEVELPRRKKLINIALHSCRAQMSLLETLVDTGRLENGELTPRKTMLDTKKFIANTLSDIAGAASHLGVTLIENAPGPLPPRLEADADLFPRAVFNLLHNALKYTPAGGTVKLSISHKNDAFHFAIEDTGVGIAPEHIDRLFKKYYRVEEGDQTSRRGSGLGLYFCRMVVEAHGGKIGVSSGVGRGTTVAFNIPQRSVIHEPKA